MNDPALALLEFKSIAAGIEAGDAMVKRAPVGQIQAGTVHPGRYLVLVAGDVAAVEEAVEAGKEVGGDCLLDWLFLPNVHLNVVMALGSGRSPEREDALGIIETETAAAAIRAADAGVKGAEVNLWQLRLADGLGGKGLVLYTGLVSDVAAAVEIGGRAAAAMLVRQVVIPQLHDEMRENVRMSGRFGDHFNWSAY